MNTSSARLPAGPFREWIARTSAEMGCLADLEARVGHDLHKIASGQYRTVGLDLADEVLARAGVHLYEVYPDLYEGEVEPLPNRRGGWKRPDKWVRYSPAQLRLLYKLHLEQGQSINFLAKSTWETVGYKNHQTAARAITSGWKRLGLAPRDRIEQVRLTCTKHGRAPKHGPRVGYKPFLRRQRGDYRPRCKGFRTQAPRKGEPCHRPAMRDSGYCVGHDPLRTLQVQAHLARMRRLKPRDEMLPMGPFSEWLERLAAERGSLKAACEYHGLRYDQACRYRKGLTGRNAPKTEIGRTTVERWLEPVGADLSDLYGLAVAA